MKIIGVVPARMNSTRFYGKPLYKIYGIPMIEHVFERAKMAKNLDQLVISSCDREIEEFALNKGYNFISSSSSHERALDRVAEVGDKLKIDENDIIVNIQGDEPMLDPDFIDLVIQPIKQHPKIHATVLGMEIIDEKIWKDPDTVKIIHNNKNEVLYTSRAPIPYGKKFSKALNAKRIFGIFGFRFSYLKAFNKMDETFLEKIESCDSNRILDLDFKQVVVPINYQETFSVDKVEDVDLVENFLGKDKYLSRYL